MSEPDPQPEPALVLERWNSWVRLWFPSSGGSGWINLDEVGWAPFAEPSLAEGSARPETGARHDVGLGGTSGRAGLGALP